MNIPKKVVVYHPIRSLRYAVEGLQMAFTREPNLTFQVIIGVGFSLLGIWSNHTVLAMANLILMGIVISLEMINAAIETLCDIVHPDYNLKVKIVKDMAAGAVLMTSLIWATVIIYQILIIFVFKISQITI